MTVKLSSLRNRLYALFFLLVFLGTEIPACAQRPEPEPHVFIYINGNKMPMRPVTSMTEMKKGWDIQGIQVGQKLIRYFWNKESKQWATPKQRFAIYPQQETLNDYAFIRLKTRKDHRRLPDAQLTECSYIRINIDNCIIENLPEMGFAVTPKEDLFPGEYILVNLKQEPVNDAGDIIAYDFSVKK